MSKLADIDFVLLAKTENDRVEASEHVIKQLIEHLELGSNFIMPNPITVYSSTNTCRYYLDQLGWTWQNPRITDWFVRVQQHYSESLWANGKPIPEFVKASLAERLEYHLKCQQLLNALGWNWGHPTVLNVYNHFGHSYKLSLAGYKKLFNELEEAHLMHF